ncbi:MAG: ATP-binding cassette domain-containing protein, partial [Pseudomonadota bacterium]
MSDAQRNIIPFSKSGEPAHRHAASALSIIGIRLERAGKPLLDNVTLNLRRTGITVMMGHNGAGKSLLLRLIADLIEPTEGSIQLNRDLRGRMAIVFQRPVLLRRSVRANLEHALRIYGTPRVERQARLHELLRMGGLVALIDQPARRLSGGEQQRLAMVRALAANPRLLLLDEPTASLDPQSTLVIEELIRKAALEMKVLLVTHDRGQAQRLADEIVFLHQGCAIE